MNEHLLVGIDVGCHSHQVAIAESNGTLSLKNLGFLIMPVVLTLFFLKLIIMNQL
jgi:hypothetical protein